MSDRPNRSVVDYDSEDALRRALQAVQLPDDNPDEMQTEVSGAAVQATSCEGQNDQMETELLDRRRDWVLPSFDPETTEAQSMEQELRRLQVLKSYLILDHDREEAFERFTGLAARFYRVPIALISLVDLGRQWFMSNRGLGDVRETPRKHAFCAHAIMGKKHSILIVPDATKDFRFKDNPLVTGAPNIRFYAGAPLVSPEGYKLGTFCIIDDRTRPAGLSEEEQASLRDLADMAVKEMVERRSNLKRHQDPAQLIAYTAHDLMTPLTGVQLSLSLLKEDEEVKDRLGGHQQELLSTASNCSEYMIRICQTAIDTLRAQSSTVPDLPAPSLETKRTPATKLSELTRSLAMIMEPIPKKVPLVITLDPEVPPTIMSDDLKLFRSTLNLVSNAIGRTEFGAVHLKISSISGDNPKIIFECMDTGPEIQEEEYQYLFYPNKEQEGDFRLSLSSVATLISSLEGEYGFRPRSVSNDGTLLQTKQKGSVFWFSVPMYTPETFGVASEQDSSYSVIRRIGSKPSMGRQEIKPPKIVHPVSQKSTIPDGEIAASTNTTKRNGLTRNKPSTEFSSTDRSPRDNVPMTDRGQVESEGASCIGNSPTFLTDKKQSQSSRVLAGPSQSNKKRQRTALIIDDSAVVRKMLAHVLKKLGMVVSQAVNGLEGLNKLKGRPYDLVILDFLMPVMDGIDCVRQYREWESKNRPEPKLYIVGISAHADASDGDKGIKEGMDEFRPKPVGMPQMNEILKLKKVEDISKQLDAQDSFTGGLESGGSSTSLSMMGKPASSLSVHAGLNLSRGNGPGLKHTSSRSDLKLGSAKNNGSSLRLNRGSSGLLNAFGSKAHLHKRAIPGTGSISSQQNQTFDLQMPHTKRPKMGIDLSSGPHSASDDKVPFCLIATDRVSLRFNSAIPKLQDEKWKVEVVEDGQQALEKLKSRNWNAVLIDDNLAIMPGAVCVDEFRVWEQQTRVNRQRNLFMVCSSDIPSCLDDSSTVLPPTGFNGVLRRPVTWKELNKLMGMKRGWSMEPITNRMVDATNY